VEKIEAQNLDPKFKYDVAEFPGGENIKLCYACGTCTAGCPVSAVDDEFNPRKIIRQILLGMRKEVLSNPVIWRCVQCYSCTSKCPQNVKFRDVMRALREMAVAEGYADADVLAEVAELDKFAQQMRRDMVNILISDKKKYAQVKDKVAKTVA